MSLYERILDKITEHRTWITRRMIAERLSDGWHTQLNPSHIIVLTRLERDGKIEVRRTGRIWEYKAVQK